MDNYNKIQIGLNIAKYRLRSNLTQKLLAEIVDIKPATLSQYERGVNGAGIITLHKISDALKITIDHLLDSDYSISDSKFKEFET